MRVLGVDPGLTRCGLGVVDGGRGGVVGCVAVDVVRTPADPPLARRLQVHRWRRSRSGWTGTGRTWWPSSGCSASSNVRTVMGTAQAAGVVALLAARAGLPVRFHTPSEVKAAVTGQGRADKEQVTAMVTRLLGLAEAPSPADAADALALAICHSGGRRCGADGQAQARSAELARPAGPGWPRRPEATR